MRHAMAAVVVSTSLPRFAEADDPRVREPPASPWRAAERSGAEEDRSAIAGDILRDVPYSIDVGLEFVALGDIGRAGPGGSVEVDAALCVFRDPIERPRLVARIVDDLHGRAHVADRWPMFARPVLEVHLGVLGSLTDDREQSRMSFGTGLGPLGVAVAGLVERRDGNNASFVGPELRLRHRFGPAERSPSVGLVARADFFVSERDRHDDRFLIGAYGMFDLF
jgi:hypothetical protein